MRTKINQTTARTQADKEADAGYEVSRFALNVGLVLSALIGIWGLSCLIFGLATSGVGGLLRGFWTAITGN